VKRALLLLICVAFPLTLEKAEAADWPVQTSEREIVSSWGTCEYVDVFTPGIFPSPATLQPDGNNRYYKEYFAHTGIDIPADAGTECVALEEMRVTFASHADHLYRFESTSDSTRAFVYSHVVDIPNDGITLNYGATVQAGVAFATIGGTSVAHTTFPHLHFGTASVSEANAGNHSFPDDLTNPFYFPNLLENDPGGNAPKIRAVYIGNSSNSSFFDGDDGYVYGTVEISGDITDNMGAAIDPQTKNVINEEVTEDDDDAWFSGSKRTRGIVSSPYKIVFSIENASGQSVLSNAHEFIDYDKPIDQRIYGLPNGELPEDGKDAYFAQQGSFPKHVRYRYIYDLTSLEDEASSGFIGEHWVTNLAAGATDEDDKARINSEAEFPDGNYTLKIHAEDVVGGTGHVADQDVPLVVDNFAPCLRSL
jgi:hypothetical protein